jgi:hypothetical protein
MTTNINRPTRASKEGVSRGTFSGIETKIYHALVSKHMQFEYEPEKIAFTQPEKERTYTPDFVLQKIVGGKMYIETKGWLTKEDRHKHEWIKQQHPDLDIRFIFTNGQKKIYKGSKTSYAVWAAKLGYLSATKEIPADWIAECKRTYDK